MVTGSVPVSGANVTVNYALLDSSALNTTTLEYSTANDTLPNQISNDTVVSRLVSADSSGSFSDSCSLNKTGKWIVWATWNGSETYFGASSAYRNVTVNKVYISVTCNASSTVTIGDNITVTGSVYPVTENLPVTVIFIATNSTVKQTAYTSSNGTYLVRWKPDSMGMWQVHATIAENASISEPTAT